MKRYAIYLAKVLLVFAVLGPLVGLVTFSLGVASLAMIGGNPQGFWLAPFFLLYGLIFAHFAGIAWALIAGTFAAVLAVIVGRAPWWIGLSSGIASCTAAFVSGSLPMPTESPGADLMRSASFGFAVVVAVTHVAASLACWAIARRFAMPAAVETTPPSRP